MARMIKKDVMECNERVVMLSHVLHMYPCSLIPISALWQLKADSLHCLNEQRACGLETKRQHVFSTP